MCQFLIFLKPKICHCVLVRAAYSRALNISVDSYFVLVTHYIIMNYITQKPMFIYVTQYYYCTITYFNITYGLHDKKLFKHFQVSMIDKLFLTASLYTIAI